MIVQVNVVLNRTVVVVVVVDSDWRFDNLCGGRLQSCIASVDGIKL